MQTYRPIAPMALGARHPESPSYVAARAQRRHRTSTACNECRKQKSKCSIRDGETRCDRCLLNQLECIVEIADDLRRKMAQKRRIRELEEDRKILLCVVETLVGALGECPDSHVKELVCLVRKKAPLKEIRIFLGHASSSSDKSDEETVAASVVACQDVDCVASDCGARHQSSDEFIPGPTRIVQKSSSCARLSIRNLIDTNEIAEEKETLIASIPDLPTRLASRQADSVQLVDSSLGDCSMSTRNGITATMDHLR